MRRVAVVLLGLVLGWLGVLSSYVNADAAATVSLGTYTYDAPHHDAPGNYTAPERGPPAEGYDRISNDTVDLWSHGAEARVDRAASASTTIYAYPATLVQAALAIGTTARHAVAADGELSSPERSGVAAETGPRFFRGARGTNPPSFTPRPNEFKVDPETGLVRDTHGVSVFDNPGSVSGKGFTPHEIDQSTIPDELRIIQRGQDPHHYEIVPQPGANLTPEQFGVCLSRIRCY